MWGQPPSAVQQPTLIGSGKGRASAREGSPLDHNLPSPFPEHSIFRGRSG